MTSTTLVTGFLFGMVGLGFFLYGKKQVRLPQLAAGIALMVYPYFVGSATWMLGIGVAVIAGLWLTVRAGL